MTQPANVGHCLADACLVDARLGSDPIRAVAVRQAVARPCLFSVRSILLSALFLAASSVPADAGMDAGRLGGFRKRVGGRGCVVRHGKLVYSWGDIAMAGDVASACKPWFVHFLLLLLQQGTIKSLDDPVLPLEPRLKDLNA